ncbi:AmiS/UreI family transporter [Bacillus sp. ISL-35]|uniref:AmiS/UreI family transporter n=1 Tax=Bacillus sp. ISL-35 TaxID=2819122 RepID=UPI001BE7E53A|nr:AmiS/UreI family transporter [Bacillus sp. ISL-35]MBT2681629.1 AmiS/UreI family transporter [Bacillus sp. ISL-35]MBT2705097.1 AmiS/UreI family transporter [Chryseobacterium sp. ISL-80]
MGDAGLLLSGAALFLNSLMLLGKANAKSVAVFNLFIGAMQVIVPFYLIIASDQSNWTIYSLASIFLFGFTYLYVGMTLLKDLDGSGLGWYSLWVAVIALIYAFVAYIHFEDIVNTLTWLMWAYLWFLFFLSMGMNKKIDAYIGKVAMVQSWLTLTFPALLSMTGLWKSAQVAQAWIYFSIAAFVYFAYITIKLKKATARSERFA